MSATAQDHGSRGCGAPVIVRIAGLPADAVAAFASPACQSRAEATMEIEDRLAAARARMVERLHESIHGAAPAVRRVLLAAKRDCFNGRSLGGRRATPEWPTIHGAEPDLAEQICALEDRLAAATAGLAETFAAERDRERRHLVELLGDDNLMRGLALASPVVFRHLDRLRKPPAAYRRKERKLAQTLLRYASRAALKLSPFSTLTRVGLGLVHDGPRSGPVTLTAGQWRPRMLRRVKKEMVNRYLTLLELDATIRGCLPVGLNSTVEEVEPTIFRFIRAPRWSFSRDEARFVQREGSLVSVKLSGALIERLREALSTRRPLDELVALVAERCELPPAEVARVVDSLLDLGFLELRAPWPTIDGDPEKKLLDLLRTLPADGFVGELGRALEELLALRQADVDSRRLRPNLAQIDAAAARGLEALTRSQRLDGARVNGTEKSLHEDVFLEAPGGEMHAAVAGISRSSAEEALASARPILLYSDLNCIRYELLHTFQALAIERWPGRRQVGLLELLQASQKVWRDYLKAATAAIRERRRTPWNPLRLDAIEDLQELRKDVNRAMAAVVKPDGDDFVIRRDEAEDAVRRIPRWYRPHFGPCLFMQPAGPAGEDLWVLNHLLDGTGRFSTRYTTVMPPETRAFWTAHYCRRGRIEIGDEVADVVDVLSAHDDHLNVHAIQTPRVLEVPGEASGLPRARRLELRDLRVGLDETLPYLMDASGGRVLPVFLGATSLVNMPVMVQVVSLFGMAEFRLLHPRRRTSQRGDTAFSGRLRIGNLILRRRRWAVSPEKAFGDYARVSDAELFQAIHRWRRCQGLPARVFVTEKLVTSFKLWDVFKPQYVDLTSPSFMPLLRTALDSCGDELKIEEMLPLPEAFPADSEGRRWAFEVQLESIALTRPSARRAITPETEGAAVTLGVDLPDGASAVESGARRGPLIHPTSLMAHHKGDRYV